MKKILLAIFLGTLITLALSLSAFAVTLEQVQVSPPHFDVYIYDDGSELSEITTSDISATLGDEELSCTSVALSEQGIFYFFMLDISGSMPDAHFEAAKDAVLNAYSGLRPQDKLAVISFGNEVSLLLEGHEDRSEVQSAISSLSSNDEKTMFYTAMDKLIQLAPQTENMRRIAVVISDGIDDSDAALTQEQLEEKLINSGVSVYALCIDSAAEADIGSFKSFIHVSGGELYTFGPESAEAELNGLLARLGNSLHIKLVSGGYIPAAPNLLLNVQIGGYGSVSAELSPDEWAADEKAPYVISTVYSPGTQTLDLVFSEPITGGDELRNYSLSSSDGVPTTISSAANTSGESDRVSLYFDPLPIGGIYTLSVSGIKDLSPAANVLEPYEGSVHLATGVRAGDEPSGLFEGLLKYILLGILPAAFIIGAILAIVKLRKKADKSKINNEKKKPGYRRMKKLKDEKNSGGMFIFMGSEDKHDTGKHKDK